MTDTVSEFQSLAAERNKTLTAALEPRVTYCGDEALIRRLTAILLDNALKYCDPGGRIQVTLSQRRHPVLTVENTYAEVGTLELDRLFDRFYRADKARTVHRPVHRQKAPGEHHGLPEGHHHRIPGGSEIAISQK